MHPADFARADCFDSYWDRFVVLQRDDHSARWIARVPGCFIRSSRPLVVRGVAGDVVFLGDGVVGLLLQVLASA